MLEFPKYFAQQDCYLGNMQGAAKGGHPMQAILYGLSKQGNAADCLENSLVEQNIWETQAYDL